MPREISHVCLVVHDVHGVPQWSDLDTAPNKEHRHDARMPDVASDATPLLPEHAVDTLLLESLAYVYASEGVRHGLALIPARWSVRRVHDELASLGVPVRIVTPGEAPASPDEEVLYLLQSTSARGLDLPGPFMTAAGQMICGGVLLVLGHLGMAYEGEQARIVDGVVVRDEAALQVFYLSLALIIMGVGFLKPNISTIVGKLYAENDPRRDSGFSLFYAGINLGALFASLICGFLGEAYGWKYGFGAAGIGMLAGLAMFLWGQKYLHGHAEPAEPARLRERIQNGESFATLAKSFSEDPGSALNGGDLNWIDPNALVPEFREVMAKTPSGQLSEPFKSPYGWHVLEVLGRRATDSSEQYREQQAMNVLRNRKYDEELEAWLRQIRDEAYVEIKL